MTATGAEVITRFPAEDLLIAGRRYFTVDGPLPTAREAQSHLNTTYADQAISSTPNGQPVR